MRLASSFPLAVLVLASFVVTPAYAGPPLLPPQLLTACAKLPVGSACSVDFQGKHLTGVCQELPDQSRACLPDKGGARRKPKRAP